MRYLTEWSQTLHSAPSRIKFIIKFYVSITPSRFIEILKQKYIKPKFGIVSHVRIPSQMTHWLITPSRFIEILKQKYIKPKFGIVSHSRLLLLLAFRSCI